MWAHLPGEIGWCLSSLPMKVRLTLLFLFISYIATSSCFPHASFVTITQSWILLQRRSCLGWATAWGFNCIFATQWKINWAMLWLLKLSCKEWTWGQVSISSNMPLPALRMLSIQKHRGSSIPWLVRHATVQDPSAREMNEQVTLILQSAVSYHKGISIFAGNKLQTVYEQQQNFPITSTYYRWMSCFRESISSTAEQHCLRVCWVR